MIRGRQRVAGTMRVGEDERRGDVMASESEVVKSKKQ